VYSQLADYYQQRSGKSTLIYTNGTYVLESGMRSVFTTCPQCYSVAGGLASCIREATKWQFDMLLNPARSFATRRINTKSSQISTTSIHGENKRDVGDKIW